MQVILCENLWYKQAGQMLLRDITLSHAQRECMCLLGPSGSGKTTLMHLLAGKKKPASGAVHADNCLLADESCLKPHLTAADNILHALRRQKQSREEREDQLMQLLSLFHLEEIHAVRCQHLSSSQRQRVMLACCAAHRPDTLLVDDLEDVSVLEPLREWMVENGTSLIYSLRSPADALHSADRIALLMNGKLVQCDTPDDLLQHPATLEAALYMNPCTVLTGTVTGINKHGSKCKLDSAGVELEAVFLSRPDVGDLVHLCIPSRCLHVSKSPLPFGQNTSGTVTNVRITLQEEHITVQLPNGVSVTAMRSVGKKSKWETGDRAFICWDMKNASLFSDVPEI